MRYVLQTKKQKNENRCKNRTRNTLREYQDSVDVALTRHSSYLLKKNENRRKNPLES